MTHHGIDTMTLRYIKEVKLLTKDADADISPNNSRWGTSAVALLHCTAAAS